MENEQRIVELYVMALYATRPVAASQETGEHEVALRVAMALSSNDDEAKAHGMTQLLALCPPQEGWVNHHVTVNPVTREQLRSVLAVLTNEAHDGDEDDAPGVPELIM